MAQCDADFIEPLQQHRFVGRIDFECLMRVPFAVGFAYSLCTPVDRQAISRCRLNCLKERVDDGFGQHNGTQSILQAVKAKISAKLGATSARMPHSASAQTACSRLDPQPKLDRPRRMPAPW
jgi:hypothetical protein